MLPISFSKCRRLISCRTSLTLFLGTAVIAPLSSAHAANCKGQGGLMFLGTNRSDSKSVWVSRTDPGSYRLDAAQGSQTVDSWTRSTNGLHLSLSPVVSEGNGGTHKLYQTDGSDCLIDSQNQKHDFQLPDNIKPPGLVVPPIGGIFPGFGQRPVPPIIQIPGGTLPPTGITPSLPVAPPTGITPTLPVAPPTGITPTLPVAPPTGITPTLPPGGGGPSIVGPGNPQPPSVTRPPVGGNSTTGEDIARYGAAELANYCRRLDEDVVVDEVPEECLIYRQQARDAAVPITPARELQAQTVWNAWSLVTGQFSEDDRRSRDFSSFTGTLALGADRRLSEDLVVGFSVTGELTNTEGFGGALDLRTNGFELGPYIAMRLSQHWAIDGALTYGYSRSDIELATLEGSYDTHEFGGRIGLHGQYTYQDWLIQPGATATFNRVFSSSYPLKGTFLGRSYNVAISESVASVGTLELDTRFSRPFILEDGKILQPFVELSATYEFARPNNGRLLGADLKSFSPSPWSLGLRGGVTARLANNVTLDALGGYLSFAQPGLDTWEASLRVAIGF